MTFELGEILQSEREFRQRLAAMPIEEKLTMLDAQRELGENTNARIYIGFDKHAAADATKGK